MFPASRFTREKNRAFTLIELMVVIGIIVILMAILLPALSGARDQAYKVQTTAELTGLSSNIETYFQMFDNYPGPEPATITSNSNYGAKLSGTQNLFIALTYGMYTPATKASSAPSTAVWVSMPDSGSTIQVDSADTTGPIDLGTNKAYQPFYNPNAREISLPIPKMPIWNAGGVLGAAGGMPFPTILDRFPDALPILYFRKTPGVDGSVSYDANSVMTTQGSPAMVAEDTSVPASYYRADNKEYLDSTGLVALGGRIYPQAGISGIAVPTGPNADGTPANPYNNLAQLIVGNGTTASTTISAHGGFVLISASTDRVYGQNSKKSSKTDDLVVIGGH